MKGLALVLAGGFFLGPPQEASHVEALIELSEIGHQETLVAQVRLHPDAVREAIHALMSRSVDTELLGSASAGRESRMGDLASAHRLARAYFEAWTDPFLLQEVDRFQGWPPTSQRMKLRADSLRLAGVEAYQTEGVGSALELWKNGLDLSARVGDPAGTARSLGNIGAGFYVGGEPDSAWVYLSDAYEKATEIGDLSTAGAAVTNLANLTFDDGELEDAAELYTQAVVILSRTGEHRHLSAAQHNLALVSMGLGDLTGARDALEQSINLSRLHGYPEDEAEGLSSLADLAQAEGAYDESEQHLDRALTLSLEAGSRVAEAGVFHSRGLLNLARGAYREAENLLDGAAGFYRDLGRWPDLVAVLQDLARARTAMGDLQGGLSVLREAEELAASTQLGTSLLADLSLTSADVSLALNDYPRSLASFRKARESYRESNDVVGEAEALEGEAFLSFLREDFPEARAGFDQALRLRRLENPMDPRASALTGLYLAAAEMELGEGEDARTTLQNARNTLKSIGDPVGEAAVLAGWGELEMGFGARGEAAFLFREGLRLLESVMAPEVEWRLRVGLAEAHEHAKDLISAREELLLAVEIIEGSSVDLGLEDRTAFLADKRSAYHRLASVLISLGEVGEAFGVSEATRARQTTSSLSRGRLAPPPGVSKDLNNRRQDLSRKIDALTRQLRWGDLSRSRLRETLGDVAPSESAVREALSGAQREYTELLGDIRRSAPGGLALVDPEVAEVPDILSMLRPEQALLEYMMGEEEVLVFVLTSDTLAGFVLDIDPQALSDLVGFARGMIAAGAERGSGKSWRPPLQRLHEVLVRPVEESGLLKDHRSLLIVPHGTLHYLPFQALVRPSDTRFLIERYSISYAPSASGWLRLKERTIARKADKPTPSSQENPFGGQILAMAPRVSELPGSRYEVEVIGRLFGADATVLIGSDASEEVFRARSGEFEFVHFATFGRLNKANPLFSFVELAGTPSSPGFLEAHEVFELDLKARLLTLSACQSALGSGGLWDVPPGDDWVGLSAAFLSAGAGNVLASLWQVEDLATAELMQSFYRHLAAGEHLVGALAKAQRELLSTLDTSHPFFWAGFQLAGEGGGGM